MSSTTGYGGGYQPVVAEAVPEQRQGFLVRTYLHLFGAILAFVALEVVYFQTGFALSFAQTVLGAGGVGWLVVLGLFMVVGWLADRWAMSDTSQTIQYAGLGLYVVAQSVIFIPLLVLAAVQAGDFSLISSAALITVVLFGCLTGVVFVTGKDFSFLRSVLVFGGFAAMGFIVAAVVFGFTLGVVFSWAMLAFAGCAVLYSTSNVMLHYRTTQHVAAALSLFAAIALMFWYVLRIFMSRD